MLLGGIAARLVAELVYMTVTFPDVSGTVWGSLFGLCARGKRVRTARSRLSVPREATERDVSG